MRYSQVKASTSTWTMCGTVWIRPVPEIITGPRHEKTCLWMRRLVCASVVRKPLKTGFLTSRPKCSTVKLRPSCGT